MKSMSKYYARVKYYTNTKHDTIRLANRSDGSVLEGLRITLYAKKEELNFKRYYFRYIFSVPLHIRYADECVRFAYGTRIRNV